MEKVDAHVDALFEKLEKDFESKSSVSFCDAYRVARPVILWVKGLLFFRPKWQKVLTIFVATLDVSCPPDQE